MSDRKRRRGRKREREERKRKRDSGGMSERSASVQIYSRLCGTFWRCGRTVVAEGGEARRIPRERGSLLSRSSSRRRAFHPLCVYVYTRLESGRRAGGGGEGERGLHDENGWRVVGGRPRDETLLRTDRWTWRPGKRSEEISLFLLQRHNVTHK